MKKMIHSLRSKLGFSLAEVMVMIIITSSCMVPILGTLQNGLERTQGLGHKARIQQLCTSRINDCIASGVFQGVPIDVGSITISWPTSDPQQFVATYIIETAVIEDLLIATMANSISPDALTSSMVGTQPSNLRMLVVSVSMENTDPLSSTETVKLSLLVSSNRSVVVNMIYLSDSKNHKIHVLDPISRAIVRSYDLDTTHPGNIAIHPNNKYLAIQVKHGVALLNIDDSSLSRGTLTTIYNDAGVNFLEDDDNVDKIKKDRGIAFRPDGKYLYVTAHGDVKLYVFNVPTNVPVASLTIANTALYGSNICTDMSVGQDGYLYLCANQNKLLRMNMNNISPLEDYIPTTLTIDYPPKASKTSRNGREVFSIWGTNKNEEWSWNSSADPASGTSGFVGAIDSTEKVDPDGLNLVDVDISQDGLWAVLANQKKGTAKDHPCFVPFIRLPPNPSTTQNASNMFVTPSNQYVLLGKDETTRISIASPYWPDMLLDREGKGKMALLDIASSVVGSYWSDIPVGRVTSIGTDATDLAVRSREEILVGTSDNANNYLEFIDLYGLDKFDHPIRYEEYKIKLEGKPVCLAMNGEGSIAVVASGTSQRGYGSIDMINHDLGSGKSICKYAAARDLGSFTFLLDGSFLWVEKSTVDPTGAAESAETREKYHVIKPRAWSSNDRSPDDSVAAVLNETLLSGEKVIDLVPLNNGGAMVLTSTWSMASAFTTAGNFARLHRIGNDNKVWARWDSRYDNFPPPTARRLAVSADDSLLALYDPVSVAADADTVSIYDLNSQNFGNLTQQNGLIHEIRASTNADFSVSVTAGQKFTGAGINLTQAFTANDTVANNRNYPANFYFETTTTNKYNANSARFFGYFNPPATVQRFGMAARDGARLILDGSLIFSQLDYGFIYTGKNCPISPVSSKVFQIDRGADDGVTGNSLWVTSNSADANPTASTYSESTGFSAITPAGSWTRIASSSCHPLRFSPQFLYTYKTTQTNLAGDQGKIVFSRDVASPTLYFLDQKNARLNCIYFGETAKSFSLFSSPGSGTPNLMAISPDGQRLIITATSPSSINFVDISTPITTTYGTIVASQTLPQAPICLATRPFNRFYSKRDVFEVIASLNRNVAGNNLAAVASGGIYIAGGSDGLAGVATKTVNIFNPVSNKATFAGTLPQPIKGHSVVSYDNGIFSLNGIYPPTLSSVPWWVNMTSMTTARRGVGAALLDGKIYVVGGAAGSTNLSTVEAFNGTSWSSVINMPTARRGVGVAVFQGKLYAVGGATGASTYTNKVEYFDGSTWVAAANLNTIRGMPAVVVYKGYLWAIGGINSTSGCLKTVEYFDGTTWTNGADFTTTGRSVVAAAVLNDKLYAIGGSVSGTTPTNTVNEFDGTTWTTGTSLPAARSWAGAAVLNDKIYVLGGESPGAGNEVSSTLVFDGTSWTSGYPMNSNRTGLGAAVAFNDKIFALAGSNGGDLNTVEYLELPPPPPPAPSNTQEFASVNNYSNLADDALGVINTSMQSACLTPYGPFINGGNGNPAKSRAQVWWPHAVAVDNEVYSWGYNAEGQLGDGTITERHSPVDVLGATNIKAIAGGESHTVALKHDGTVWAWGNNAVGQLGDGTTTNRASPVQVTGLTGVTAVAAGHCDSLAIKNDGTVWGWGFNSNGQLGDGTLTNRTFPVQVTGLTGVTAVAAGYTHSLALKNDGTVWGWGYNAYGQLGNGTTLPLNQLSPVQVTGLSGITAIAVGTYHSLALKNNGTVWTWGCNDSGQICDGLKPASRTTPFQISGLSGVTAVAGGGQYSLAAKNDGTVYAWGENNYGQLGDGSSINRLAPVLVSGLTNVKAIAGSILGYHTAALKWDGNVWAWGRNDKGQLGDGTTTDRPTPVKVSGLDNVSALGCGSNFTMTLKKSTQVAACGYNGSGQLGDGTTIDRKTLTQVKDSSGSVFAGVMALAWGTYHTIALKIDGTVWGWGNNVGQLGDGTAISRSSPVKVVGLTNVTAVGAGVLHSLAVKNDGTAWAWGINNKGQLGDGTTTQRNSPVQVSGLTGVTAVVGGNTYSMAVKNDGTVWAWGINTNGQLGDGTTTDRYTPVQVVGLTGVKAVAAKENHSLALKYDGTVWAWGWNVNGQLGDGTNSQRTSPVQVSGLTGVTAVSAGQTHSIAVINDGTVKAWGSNNYGQLGDGTTTSRNTPVSVAGLTGITAAKGGIYCSLVVKNDGTTWVWGYNTLGQLGDGTETDRMSLVQVKELTGVTDVGGGYGFFQGFQTVPTWGLTRDLPASYNEQDHLLVCHKNKVYRIGGRSSNLVWTGIQTQREFFDFDLNAWNTSSGVWDTSFRRGAAAACSFGDQIYIFGGLYDPNTILTTGAAWNPETNTYRTLASSIPKTEHLTAGVELAPNDHPVGMTAVPCGPYIYLIGGAIDYVSADSGTCKVIRYTP
ncbi:MAG: kelch repeat-containing protein [Candidatus Ozemobacteraceae bacterium]